MKHRLDYSCGLCRIERRGEFAYMLNQPVWKAAIRRGQRLGYAVSSYHLLCIGCVEDCLGRQLVRSDFNWIVPLNFHPDYKRSERLLSRMKAA